MYVFKADMARMMLSPTFGAAATGLILAAFFGNGQEIVDAFLAGVAIESGQTIQIIHKALTSSLILFAVPILAAIPYTASFVEDVDSRFARSALPRCTRSVYLRSRIATNGLSGALSLTAGAMLTCAVLCLMLLPLERVMDPAEAAAGTDATRILEDVGLLFLSGTLWSLFGALFAAASMNRYVGLAGPFIFYYVLVILAERYFPDLYTLNPKEWIAPSDRWQFGSGSVALIVAILCAACTGALYLVMEKRIRNV